MAKNTVNFAEFVRRSRDAHGDKYVYHAEDYVNTTSDTRITCSVHGDFYMSPIHHYRYKQGCPKCVGRGLSRDDVIKIFREVHSNEYEYDRFVYTKMHDISIMTCKKHGDFPQSPSKHINGRGCPKCAKEKLANLFRKPFNKFVEESKKIHGGKYEYIDDGSYRNAHSKIRIICPIHGEFIQIAGDHLNGHGCSKCNESRLEVAMRNYLDAHGIKYKEQVKSDTFCWLKKQSLDFYLPEHNVAIECQGEQHFKAVEFFGGDEEFKKTVERDKRKKKLCEENFVNIVYFNRNDDVETFFKKIL